MEHGEGSQTGQRNPRSSSGGQQQDAAMASGGWNTSSHNRDQDCYVPMANITRIMRRALPPHAKIADDAKETVQECVSEYINLITSEANDRCHREQRKTINAEDVLWAMGRLGFDNYTEPLRLFLERYHDAQRERNVLLVHGDPVVRQIVGFRQLPPLPNYGLPLGAPPNFPVVQHEGILDISRAAAMNGMNLGYYADNAGAGSSSSGQDGGPGFGPYAHFK
ncbi:nuclear transcription factor Y subunit B-4-like [Actinidia eriantha]|uniref:nuclear transcription factor Y subunit B-4-like n=1 Tax=Actinidia eriantha TaxID=165200 RepID=UPI00258E9582|nr:nuclear transcription factor Y subunit B-4-like [Actinidia eriantha]